jgi:hypothetical protein
LKRTRRVEVIRYSRRVDVQQVGFAGGIDELLAIARTREFTCEGDDAGLLPEPIPVRQPSTTLRSRARRLLRKFKTRPSAHVGGFKQAPIETRGESSLNCSTSFNQLKGDKRL